MKEKVAEIVQFNDRQARLLVRRSLKMARSAHAYVRGNTRKFYEWLDAADIEKIPHGPAVWICGDCHVGNHGPIANAKGHIDIQIRDLDQTVIGNPAHDLIRLGLSSCHRRAGLGSSGRYYREDARKYDRRIRAGLP